jgi:hypothetical protein
MGNELIYEAKQAAEYVRHSFFSAHRGAILWRSGVVAVFANDGYIDDTGTQKRISERAARVTSALRAELSVMGLEELGFGSSTNEYSWAMLVGGIDAEPFHRLVWELDKRGCSGPSGYHLLQSKAAEATLSGFWHTPVSA